MARLILGNTDASASGRGWIAPTAHQPVFASFFTGDAVNSNMSVGGSLPLVVGAPALHPGVIGQTLPYMATKGGSNYLKTTILEPRELTVFAVARMPVPPDNKGGLVTDGAVMGTYGVANADFMMVLTAATAPEGAIRARIPGSPAISWNATPPRTGDMTGWGLYAMRYRRQGAQVEGLLQALTCNASEVRTGPGIDRVSPIAIEIGSQPNADNSQAQRGEVHHAVSLIWDVPLSDGEMSDVAALLRRWCARYGVTV
ncbi:hypothetical protein [Asaia spathodeae]|uniref:Uncharacterized protein n=1 Tax=Asaia spathodeae TaxID=657016 RepID=A0ABX2P442_9PROT|nr:hypothetical protein [Asaia spathodeae]GBR18597.1 hypothetical protein AA105894_2111 [Asaia spathodeae NBRC 105894]